jgi:hypothetical protein
VIAALFVQKGGAYFGLPDVDPWDEERDARLYAGPWPVVAHPPCARWSRLAGMCEAKYGLKRGDDGGCFASALASVRRWGGVLEHPADTRAWDAFSLPVPPSDGGWVRGIEGGWSCCVEQGSYGHPAPKRTWLYAYGVRDLPSLRWGPSGATGVCVSSVRARARRDGGRIPARMNLATPPAFRDVLIGIARSVNASPHPVEASNACPRHGGYMHKPVACAECWPSSPPTPEAA